MPSILVEYDGEKAETRRFGERLRGLAWNQDGSRLTLVGNGGLFLTLHNEEIFRLKSGVKHNLRAVAVNPTNNTSLAVGNLGTVITAQPDGALSKVSSPTFENLRAVRWNSEGSLALIVGNNGAFCKYAGSGLEMVDDGRANLRGIAWRKDSDDALISSNCFAEEFIPSPNLFSFDHRSNLLKPVNEGRTDLISVDWTPDGSMALVVGYDVVWHNGFMARFDGTTLTSIKFENERVYPVTVRWDPTGRVAAIATSTTQPNLGQGRIMLWDGDSFKTIYRSDEYFFSQVAWAPVGFKLAAIASTEARTFDS